MGLEDKFYPDDGTLLTKYDNRMIKSAGAIGDVYQNLTGDSYKNLVKGSYALATLSFLSSTGLGNIAALLFAITTYEGYKDPKYRTPLEEDIIQEKGGFPKKGRKIARILIPAIGAAMFYFGYSKPIENNSYFMFSLHTSYIFFAVSTVPWTFADYLSLAHLPKPPEKNVFERMKENLSNLVLAPQHIPISSF